MILRVFAIVRLPASSVRVLWLLALAQLQTGYRGWRGQQAEGLPLPIVWIHTWNG